MARPRKAAQLKVLQGNFRKDRDSHGPQVDLTAPPCPVWLTKSAKKYWKQVAPELEKVGLISLIDSAAFAAHCDSAGRYEDITRELKTIDDMLSNTPQGFKVQNVLWQIRNKLWEQVMKSSNEFGLTPAGRSKVKPVEQQQLPLNGWDDI